MAAAIKAALYARDAARETQRSANEAKRSADASELSNEQSKELGLAQVRPYLHINKIEFLVSDNDYVSIIVHLKNVGQTPALSAKVDMEVGTFNQSLVLHQFEPKTVDLSYSLGVTVMSSAVHEFSTAQKTGKSPAFHNGWLMVNVQI